MSLNDKAYSLTKDYLWKFGILKCIWKASLFVNCKYLWNYQLSGI